jgi:hypothetical protein
MPGARYELVSLGQTGAPAQVPDGKQLHTVSASLFFAYRFTERWGLGLSVVSSLSGDFAEVDADHLRFAGAGLASYAFSERFSLGAGVLFTSKFGRPLVLPAIRVDWQILDELRLIATLPTHAELAWRLHDRVELGLSASIRGQVYALTAEPDACAASGERCADELAYSRGELGPTAGVRLTSTLWLSLHAGFAFYRRHDLLEDGGSIPGDDAPGLEPNVLVEARLVFRIPGA